MVSKRTNTSNDTRSLSDLLYYPLTVFLSVGMCVNVDVCLHVNLAMAAKWPIRRSFSSLAN